MKTYHALPINAMYCGCDDGTVKPPHTPLDQAPIHFSLFSHSHPPRTFYNQLPFLFMLNLQQHLQSNLFFLAKLNKFKTKPKYGDIKGTDRWSTWKTPVIPREFTWWYRDPNFCQPFKITQTFSYCLLGAFFGLGSALSHFCWKDQTIHPYRWTTFANSGLIQLKCSGYGQQIGLTWKWRKETLHIDSWSHKQNHSLQMAELLSHLILIFL